MFTSIMYPSWIVKRLHDATIHPYKGMNFRWTRLLWEMETESLHCEDLAFIVRDKKNICKSNWPKSIWRIFMLVVCRYGLSGYRVWSIIEAFSRTEKIFSVRGILWAVISNVVNFIRLVGNYKTTNHMCYLKPVRSFLKN